MEKLVNATLNLAAEAVTHVVRYLMHSEYNALCYAPYSLAKLMDTKPSISTKALIQVGETVFDEDKCVWVYAMQGM